MKVALNRIVNVEASKSFSFKAKRARDSLIGVTRMSKVKCIQER